MARPDITGLGESLLGDKKRQYRDDEDDYKKTLLTAFAIKLGIGITNNVLKSKADDFQKSEQVLANRAKLRGVTQYGDQIKEYRTSMTKEGSTPFDFFYKQQLEKEKAKADLELQEENFSPAMKDSYEKVYSERARKLAQSRADAFLKSEEAWGSVSTVEEYDALVADKNERATTVGGRLIEAGSDFFKGTSRKEREEEILDKIERQAVLPAEQFKTLYEGFQKTGNLSDAAEAVKFVHEEPKDKINYRWVQGNGGMIKVVDVTKTNPDGTQTTTQGELVPGPNTFVRFDENMTPKEKEDRALTLMNKGNSVIESAHTYLTPEGRKAFMDQINAASFMYPPETLKDLSSLYTLNKNFIQENPTYLRDFNKMAENKKAVYMRVLLSTMSATTLDDITYAKTPEEVAKILAGPTAAAKNIIKLLDNNEPEILDWEDQ